MFGIDIGISVSSVVCTNKKYEILDYAVLFGDKHESDNWKRIVEMSDMVVTQVTEICKSKPGMIIEPLVALEEPVFSYVSRNYVSYFNMCGLYTLIRNKLDKRSFTIYSINPQSVKVTAKRLVQSKNKSITGDKYLVRGRYTKKGMMQAYEIVTGNRPDGTNNVTRETLSDAFFIAQNGIDRRRVGVK